MTLITPLSLAFALVLTGCGQVAGDDNGDDTTGDDVTGHPDAPPGGGGTPVTGIWHYDSITPVSNTCDPNVNHGEAGDFGIDQVTTTSFRVIPNDGTANFTCTLDSGVFGCPNRASHVEDYHPGADAILTVHAEAHGTFSNSTHGTGTQNATVDCVGSDCNVLGNLPCTFSQDFAISKH